MAMISLILEKINNGNNEVFKEIYGTNPDDLQEQASRYTALLMEFRSKYNCEDVHLFSAPGRTEIGGNHTDHNNGLVLAGAVNLDNIAVAAVNKSNLIRIKSIGYPDFTVDLSNLSISEEEFYTSASLVKGICAKMKDSGYNIGGFDACIEGRVPKGSGLSSSASFEVLIGVIISHLYNDGKLDPVENAIIGQWAENNYFGKPCGLMDQTACSVGGFISIDFKNPSKPVVESIDFNFRETRYALVITDTAGDHADLNEEYAAIPIEMKTVAKSLNQESLRSVPEDELYKNINNIRQKVNDRALLRAFHYFGENNRVVEQVAALKNKNFQNFLKLVIESGRSSFMYNQNVYSNHNVNEQGVSLGLAISELILKESGAWRVHGGGFAGTIQAFVPLEKLSEYITILENLFGKGKCHKLFIRPKGAIKIEL